MTSISHRKIEVRGGLVLVADDDPIFRELAAANLKELGFRPIEAEDGNAAWQALRRYSACLAIIDLDMPKLNGFSLIECMRANPRMQHVPVVVITARSDSTAIKDAFEAGATSFLTKPVDWRSFGNHVEYLMRLDASVNAQRLKVNRADAASQLKDAAIACAVASCLTHVGRITALAEKIDASLQSWLHADVVKDRLQAIVREAEDIETALMSARDLSCVLSRPDSAESKLAPLKTLLASVQSYVAEMSRERHVPVCVSRSPEDIFIACDPDEMAAALSQIITNAIKVSAPGDSIVIETQLHDDGMLSISVTDDGPGIEPDVFAACLWPLGNEHFLPTNMQESQCEGIAMVKAVANAHGGSLEIRSMPGQGATMMVTIPAERVHAETDCAA